MFVTPEYKPNQVWETHHGRTVIITENNKMAWWNEKLNKVCISEIKELKQLIEDVSMKDMFEYWSNQKDVQI